jgi:PPOX class probable F420-dependent enzyme
VLSPAVRQFLEEMKTPAVIAFLRADGSPATSAVWYGFDEGDIVISTPAGRSKARHIGADRRISFIVDTREMPYRGVAIEGTAEVSADPEKAVMLEIARRYLGPDLPTRIYERAAAADRAVIRLQPVRVRTWGLEEQ